MTVAELIRALQACPCQDANVILQRDPEGNGYSPLRGADPESIYVGGDVYDTGWSAGEADMDPESWEVLKRETPTCVVLYPEY